MTMKLRKIGIHSIITTSCVLALTASFAFGAAVNNKDASEAKTSTTTAAANVSQVKNDQKQSPETKAKKAPAKGKKKKKHAPKLSKQKKKELAEGIKIVKLINPQAGKELETKAKKHKYRAYKSLKKILPQVSTFRRMKKNDKKKFNLRIQELRLIREAHELSVSYREALSASDEFTAEKIYEQMETVLDEHFDAKLQITELQINRTQKWLDHLRNKLSENTTKKDELINEKLQLLINPPQKENKKAKKPQSKNRKKQTSQASQKN